MYAHHIIESQKIFELFTSQLTINFSIFSIMREKNIGSATNIEEVSTQKNIIL
jgi:hypothetical protein